MKIETASSMHVVREERLELLPNYAGQIHAISTLSSLSASKGGFFSAVKDKFLGVIFWFKETILHLLRTIFFCFYLKNDNSDIRSIQTKIQELGDLQKKFEELGEDFSKNSSLDGMHLWWKIAYAELTEEMQERIMKKEMESRVHHRLGGKNPSHDEVQKEVQRLWMGEENKETVLSFVRDLQPYPEGNDASDPKSKSGIPKHIQSILNDVKKEKEELKSQLKELTKSKPDIERRLFDDSTYLTQ